MPGLEGENAPDVAVGVARREVEVHDLGVVAGSALALEVGVRALAGLDGVESALADGEGGLDAGGGGLPLRRATGAVMRVTWGMVMVVGEEAGGC